MQFLIPPIPLVCNPVTPPKKDGPLDDSIHEEGNLCHFALVIVASNIKTNSKIFPTSDNSLLEHGSIALKYVINNTIKKQVFFKRKAVNSDSVIKLRAQMKK